MGVINTGINALGTFAVLKNLFGKKPQTSNAGFQRFKAAIHASGVSRSNHFDVRITLPKMLTGATGNFLKTSSDMMVILSIYADSVSLPGLNLQTDSVKRFGVGPFDNVPYSTQYNDITINFIADGKGEIYKFFYRWMQAIIPSDILVSENKLNPRGLSPYEVEFKENYKTTIYITTYNEQEDKVLEYVLVDAFPKILPDISLSWKDSDGFMQFGITFTYMFAKLINVNEPLVGGKNGFQGLSALQKSLKIATALQTLKTIKRPTSIQDALASSTTIKNVFK